MDSHNFGSPVFSGTFFGVILVSIFFMIVAPAAPASWRDFMLWSRICVYFSYNFARAYITSREINLIGSRFEPVVAEVMYYLRAHFAIPENLPFIIFKAGSLQVFILESNGTIVL